MQHKYLDPTLNPPTHPLSIHRLVSVLLPHQASSKSMNYHRFHDLFVVSLIVIQPAAAFSTATVWLPHKTPASPTASRKTYKKNIRTISALYESSNNSDGESDRRNFLGQAGGAISLTSLLPLNRASAAPPPTTDNVDSSSLALSNADVSSSTSPKVVLWGFGNQNKLMAKYLYEKKIPVVGVISHHDIGEDYGLVDLDPWGNAITTANKPTGVAIVSEDNAATLLVKTQPDVCIMCTRSTVADLKPALTACANSKVNVITIAEELLFSSGSSPQLTKELDSLFKANGVSFTGSGFIDGACCEMALVLSSMMHKIEGLEGSLQYNVDDYGTVLAQAHGVGLSKADFEKNIVRKPQAKSYVYNSNEWFASALGLTIATTKEERQPMTASVPVKSESIGKTIPVGDCTGMKVIATTTTKEGVTIVGKQVGKCYEPDNSNDKDYCGWGFKGEPSGVQFSMDSPPTPQMTNTVAMSRIPQIIEAPPGYITSDHFAIARYKHWS